MEQPKMMNPKELIKQTFDRYVGESSEIRWNDMVKRRDFYDGNHEEYTRKLIKLAEASNDDFPFTYTAITKWIAKKISYVYKTAPERDVSTEYKDLIVKKDGWLKETERQARIFPVVALRPYVDGDVFNYQIIRLFHGVTNPYDHSKFIKMWYPVNYDGFDELFVYWDAEKYMILDNAGNPIKDRDMKGKGREIREWFKVKPNNENIYKTIPFAFCRFDKVIDNPWSGGGDDIVNANEQINLALTDLNWLNRYQSYKQLVIISDDSSDKIETGYDKVIRLRPSDNNSGQSVGATVLDLQANFTENFAVIKNQLDLLAKTRGMSLNWELQGSPSGFSLIVKNIDLLENWEDDIGFCTDWERDIFEIEKVVYTIETAKSFPETKLSVNFQDVKFPNDPSEERKNLDWGVENNYMSVLDVMRRNDKDATDAELRTKYEENKQINQELTVKPVVPFGGIVE